LDIEGAEGGEAVEDRGESGGAVRAQAGALEVEGGEGREGREGAGEGAGGADVVVAEAEGGEGGGVLEAGGEVWDGGGDAVGGEVEEVEGVERGVGGEEASECAAPRVAHAVVAEVQCDELGVASRAGDGVEDARLLSLGDGAQVDALNASTDRGEGM
jgi:hypothetical protein